MISKTGSFYMTLNALCILLHLFLTSCHTESSGHEDIVGTSRAYYFSNAGKDDNDGSKLHPLKSIVRIKTLGLNAGDSVLLAGGEIFEGTLVLNYNTTGTTTNPVLISSYGNGKAVISSG